ncbi:MAG: prolipoprotein diacylglyceryl transferase [Lachnospiraceae bacterium]|nr:prolipoprotein diacylglyceryl transferase [Lachnospiraceae bacterium]
MYNDLFSIGPFTVHGYGLMIAIGILAALFTAEQRAKKLGLKDDLIFDLTLWCAIGGFLGAKILYWITILPQIVKNPKILLDFNSGWVVYGGIIFGILAGWLFRHTKKLNFLTYFDLVMPEIALAQGFGRIGCFLAGCCYGIETDSALAVTFHSSQFAPNNVGLVPTQLLSSAFNFLHFFFLIFWAKKAKKADGQVAALYLIIYSIGRFLIEFFRGDLARGSVGAVSTSQFISIFILVFGIALFVIMTKRGKKAEAKTQEA